MEAATDENELIKAERDSLVEDNVRIQERLLKEFNRKEKIQDEIDKLTQSAKEIYQVTKSLEVNARKTSYFKLYPQPVILFSRPSTPIKTHRWKSLPALHPINCYFKTLSIVKYIHTFIISGRLFLSFFP